MSTNRYTPTRTLALCQIACVALLAQGIPQGHVNGSSRLRLLELVENNARLQFWMQLDKDEYFPAEEAVVKIAAKNPTATPMEVIDPLTWDVATFEIHGYQSEVSRVRYGKDASRGIFPVRTFKPGETAEIRVELSGSIAALKAGKGVIPNREGSNLLIFTTVGGSTQVDYHVVYPTIVERKEVRLHQSITGEATGPAHPLTKKTVSAHLIHNALVVSYKGRYHVCLTQRGAGIPMTDVYPEIDKQGSVLDERASRWLGAISRVASSDKPITSLSIEANLVDDLSVNFEIKGEGKKTVRIDARREVIK